MRAAWVAACVLLLLAPPAGAQSPPQGHVLYCSRNCLPSQVNDEDANGTPVNVILYAHIGDILQRHPLNVVPPDPGHERDVNAGFTFPTLKQETAALYFGNNQMELFYLPRFVDREDSAINMDGPLSYPMRLVGPQALAYWYLSPHSVPGMNSTSLALGPTGAMPEVTVYVRVETGRFPYHGTLIAEGKSTSPLVVALPLQDYAYEFEIPLRIVQPEVPPEEGFVVLVQWFQYRDGETEISQSDWRVRSGPRFAPRLILPIAEPARLLDTQSLVRDGVHYLATTISPVLGAYDVDPFSFRMKLVDGPEPVGDPTPLFYVYHPRHPDKLRVAWALPDTGPGLSGGEYRFELSFYNLQRTYRFHDNVTLTILSFNAAEPSGARSVGPGAVAWMGALAVVGLGAALWIAGQGVTALALRRRP